jgi:hypothetical protein
MRLRGDGPDAASSDASLGESLGPRWPAVLGQLCGVDEGEHIDAVADLGSQRVPSQGTELAAGAVVEVDADHAG